MKLAALMLTLCLAGCVTPAVQLENARRLMGRPDFSAAKAAAPDWARDALLTINALESQIERK